MRNVTHIALHTSESTFGDANAIRAWHTEKKPRGRGWSDAGYHFIIKNGMLTPKIVIPALDGQIDVGRPLSITPASVFRHNRGQIAVCLIGKNGKYTTKQIESAVVLISSLMETFNIDLEDVKGHYEYPNVSKTCPDLDMNIFRDLITHYREEM